MLEDWRTVATCEEDDWRMPPFTMTGLLTKSRLSSLEDKLLRLLASVMSDRSWGPAGLARAQLTSQGRELGHWKN